MRSFGFVVSVVGMLMASSALAQLGDARMRRANDAASVVVKERMAQERPQDAKLLEQVSAADIVVVSGEYDRVEDVLRSLGIKHSVVSPRQVARLNLNAKQLLIVNCPGDLTPAGVDRVRRFVNAGGYLYTTDWALTRVVQRAFPGYIAANGRETANDVVEVEVEARQTETSLLKHLTLSKEKPKWWLESSSYPIKVLAADKVDVLITSKEMGRKYGAAPIAVHFRYGDGQVLHIASHFYLQQNQTRTVADAKKGKDFIASDSELSPKTKQALEQSDRLSADITAGDLSSAYAAQQMTSNIVLEQKRSQARIDSLYDSSLSAPVAAPRSAQPGSAAPSLPAGARVRQLERRGDTVKVRTMEGDEAWVPAQALAH